MITYMFVSQTAGFHPSIYMVADTPKGRAAPPPSWTSKERIAALGPTQNADGLVVLLAIFTFVICIAFVVLAGLTQSWLWVPVVCAPAALVVSLARIDRLFWLIQRAHDTGRSSLWVVVPVIAITLTAALNLGAILAIEGGLTLAVAFGSMVFIALPSALVLFWLVHAPGSEGPNRYGPEPEPVRVSPG